MGKIKGLHQTLRENGLPAVAEEIETAQSENLTDFSFWGFLRQFGIPGLLKDVARLEKESKEKGIGAVARELLKNLGIEIQATTPDWLNQTGSPTLFYGNHQSFIEPLLVAALSHRDDLAFVGNKFTVGLGDNAQKHLLPVLAKRYASDSPAVLTPKEAAFIGERHMTREEIEAMNSESITEAARRLKTGWAVGIFPAPNDLDIEFPWFSGIGRVINHLPEETTNNTRLAPIRFGQISNGELAEAVRIRYKKGKEPKKRILSVEFAPTLNIAELDLQGLSDQKITEKLQADYLESFGG